MTAEAAYWDSQAPTFDDQPDHGLRDPHVRDAWRQLLLPHLGRGRLWGGPITDERYLLLSPR